MKKNQRKAYVVLVDDIFENQSVPAGVFLKEPTRAQINGAVMTAIHKYVHGGKEVSEKDLRNYARGWKNDGGMVRVEETFLA